MSCAICQHSQRQEIDQALIAGSATPHSLCQEYGLSPSDLDRHKAHLQVKMNRAKAQVQDNLLQGCLFWLSQALEMSMQTAQAAQAEGNFKIVLQALAQGSRFIKIILKQDFRLDDKMVHAILTSPQWAANTGLLPSDPQILAAGRQSVSGDFLAPCLEQKPPPASSEPACDLDLDLLQGMLTALTQSPAAQSQLSDLNCHSREKSGKLPGNIISKHKNNQLKQKDRHNKKITKNPPLSRSGSWLESLDVGRFDLGALSAIESGREL
jgi:hypothetical protein